MSDQTTLQHDESLELLDALEIGFELSAYELTPSDSSDESCVA